MGGGTEDTSYVTAELERQPVLVVPQLERWSVELELQLDRQ